MSIPGNRGPLLGLVVNADQDAKNEGEREAGDHYAPYPLRCSEEETISVWRLVGFSQHLKNAVGHLTNKNIVHPSNARIPLMADAQIGHLCYNMSGEMKGVHHDAHAYPSEKGEAKHV